MANRTLTRPIVYLSSLSHLSHTTYFHTRYKRFSSFLFTGVGRTAFAMSTRKYDFIIFGATGFTGQYVAEEVSRIAEKEGITWAVAGRNASKLRKVLDSVQKFTGMPYLLKVHSLTVYTQKKILIALGKSVKDVGVIEAEVSNASSLAAMAKMGKVVLNCVGPYR